MKDLFPQIISFLWKLHNNKIRFQTKDDVIVKWMGMFRNERNQTFEKA